MVDVQKVEKSEKVELGDLGDVIAKLEKKYGKGCVGQASTAKGIGTWRRIETGIFAVDYVTSGGIPHGAASLFWGPESGGKSALAIKTVAAAQGMCREHVVKMVQDGKEVLNRCPMCGHRGLEKECPNDPCKKTPMGIGVVPKLICPTCKKFRPHKALYMDSESSFTTQWAAKLGCDCDLIHVFQPESAEEAMDGSMMLLETTKFDVVVVDTIAQLAPKKELESSAEDWQQGLLARLMNKALRAWVSQMNATGIERLKRTTFLLINQIRFKIGVYGDPTTRPGGKGQDYAAAVELKMWAGKYEQDALGNTLGAIVCVNGTKNKTGPSARQEGNFRLWLRDCEIDGVKKFVGDTEEPRVVMDYGLKFGVIKHDGKRYEIEGLDMAGPALTSQAAVLELLEKDPVVLDFVRKCLMGKMLGEVWWDIKELDKARKKGK